MTTFILFFGLAEDRAESDAALGAAVVAPIGTSVEEAAVGFSDTKTGSEATGAGVGSIGTSGVAAGGLTVTLAAGAVSPAEEDVDEEAAEGVAGGLGPASLELSSSRLARALTGGSA
jgi:hypothetical protein